MSEEPSDSGRDRSLEALLEFLRLERGFDFTGYKPPTLTRRLRKRMETVGCADYAGYVEYLEVHPTEFLQLFNTLLINVTGFFRDAQAWDALAEQLKRSLESAPGDRPIRLWSAGCASGEEPYTMAMLLAEIVGVEQALARAKVYATDLDDEALAQARHGTYCQRAVESVPPTLLKKYFTRIGDDFVFSKELRRAVIFGRHDIAHDAPISRIDVLACRNTLMYFNAETQSTILNRLHFALAEGGILFLGKAEMLVTHGALFSPIDLKLRLFARASRVAPVRSSLRPHVRELSAREPSDGCRPTDLRSSIDAARSYGRPVAIKELARALPNGDKTSFDIDVCPLFADSGSLQGVQLIFSDITQNQMLQEVLRNTNLELERAHEELRATSDALETTNEELQSTVEELETTNEELHSTNEELETMNEELQSTNEELQTLNEELTARGAQLQEVNAFFSSVLATLSSGVAVLDRELSIKAWNRRMEDLWGLRADEVNGKHFLNLDIGIPVDTLGGPIRACLANHELQSREFDCHNRRGHPIHCKLQVRPIEGDGGGVIALFDEISLT